MRACLAVLAVLTLTTAACNRDPAAPPEAPATPPHPMAGGLTRQAIETASAPAPTPPQPAPEATPAPAPAPTDGETTQPAPPPPPQPQAALIRAQILLGRSPWSPGAIDGLQGDNYRQALEAFQRAAGLNPDGVLTAETLTRLTAADGRPVLMDYVVTQQDVAGPYIGAVPEDMAAKAALPRLGFANAREALAERFRMSEALLDALNPGADYGKVGQRLVVPAIGDTPLSADVVRIEVDKTARAVRAYDADDNLIALFPATIGSDDNPAPSGDLTILGVANEPTYSYDPARLSYARGTDKLIVPEGPNNPVGSVWIELSRDTFGIHGTPDPEDISKTASHGCVRLTNWDAERLAARVKPGVKVKFL